MSALLQLISQARRRRATDGSRSLAALLADAAGEDTVRLPRAPPCTATRVAAAKR